MTANQFRAALAKLDLSQLAAGRLLGIGPRTPRRYANGETDIPEPTAILMRLLLAGKITQRDIEAAHGR